MSVWKAILSLICLLASASQATAAKRNVLLVVTDDQGRDAGCYGNPVIRTPSLDKLASEGTLFTHAFCTTASCSPSRSVILSGLYNHANGQYGLAHSYHHFKSIENLKTLPVLLSEAGYRTVHIGKFHVEPEALYRFGTSLPANSRSPVEMAEKCRDHVAASAEKPFFLYFCTSDPHRSGDKAEELPGKPDRFGNKPEGKTYPGVKPVVYDPGDVIVPPFLPDTAECRAELAQYYQSVSRVDQGLGRLLEILKAAGTYDDTLIIYISDNGIPFPGAKTGTYDPGIRLPCVVRSPDQKKRGMATSAMITWADITPTILDFAGALKPDLKLHGRSFLSALEREKPEGWDEIFASHTFHEVTMYYPMRVVRTRAHKLIWNIASPLSYPFASDLWGSATWQATIRSGASTYGKRTVEAFLHRPPFELYDLEKDPDEVKDLSGDPEHSKLLDELKGKLKAFQERTQDPWAIKWKHE